MENLDLKQIIILENRKKLSVDNVINVDSFSEDYLELTTGGGPIGVEGENMKIEELSGDGGKIIITGEISGVFYKRAEAKKGLFASIFK